jgi:type I restriction enzyme M protein
MPEQTTSIISKVWGLCNPLRDDGVSYGDYLEQLTYLIFLKMSDEYSRPPYKKETGIPTGYGWQSKVNTKVVDESAMHFYAELLRTKELLQKAAKRATGDDKAHYQLLLRTIEQKLENK